MFRLFILCWLISFVLFTSCSSKEASNKQEQSFLVISNDISNQQITSFAEDALGHIWIGTSRGANKFVANKFRQYFNSDDSLSLCDNMIQQIYKDSQDRLWFATTNGVCIYTDKDYFRKIPIENYSQNAVELLEDKEGRIFLNMVEQLCEYRPQENKFVVVIPDFDKEEKWSNKCFIDENGDLWAVSGWSIRCYDTSNKELKTKINTTNYTHYSFLHNNRELWIASGSSLSIFDTQVGQFITLPAVLKNHPVLSKTIVLSIHPYSNSSLLLNTAKGLFLYNFLTETVIHQSEDRFPFQAPDFKITALFTDSHKNLWIGSSDQGFVTKYNYQERFNNNSYLSSQFNKKSVTSVSMDKSDNLWITTSLDGVFLYSADDKKVHKMNVGSFFPTEDFLPTQVSRIFVDKDNYIWLIAEQNWLIQCKLFRNQLIREKTFWLPTSISCMVQDENGTTYAAGFNNNIYILHPDEKDFQAIAIYPPLFVFTPGMSILSTGELFLSSFNQNLCIIQTDDWKIDKINILEHIKRTLFIPTCVLEDSGGDIWIGTYANHLFRYFKQSQQIENIQGAACTDIVSIQEDLQGNIWIGTLFGLSKCDRTTHRFVNFYKSDGIGGNQFNERSACRMNDGTLIFGGTHGLTFFNPMDVTFKQDIPLLFEELKIHNRLIFPYRDNYIDKHLSYNPVIRLKHNQNSFSLSFAALEYCEYERVHYYYMLEGFDKIWIDAGDNREAYYSNVPAGKYTFKVKITDKENTIVEVENAISVLISPSPLLSGWAYAAYIILFAGFSFFIVRLLQRMRKEKELALQAQREKEQEERVNQMNMSFFANISHEFRTPLTMISGPVMQLCDNPVITGDNKKLLFIVQRSVNRMLKLVNQLMDFNKLENDVLQLKVKPVDIISELNRLIDIFRLNANNKQINLITKGLEDRFVMWIDSDKLDEIMGNLLSNAMKFTPAGGKIILSFDLISQEEAAILFHLREKDISTQYVKLTVADTGKGIPEDKLENIFERYYQIAGNNQETYNWGTGIGLYYARRLAELHHGYIKAAKSEEGALFTFLLPVDEHIYTVNEKEPDTGEQKDIFPLQTDEQYRGLSDEYPDKEPYKIIVVDDDSEIIHYLKTLLSSYYHVIACYEVNSAMKIVEEESPDLILSDVVMPDISGYDFCRMIKNNLQLCHIPVVLVTAKTTVESQVAGLNTGADAYVTKPFDPAYLLALINSQLKNRENVRKLLGSKTQTDKIEQNILSPQDNVFMTELYRLMETELSNPELNISRMTEVLKISRTKLYYKIKGLIGTNPNAFFKTYKLNRAAELLLEGKYNISEISDITGFSTLPHFSASFKKQFGVSPSEYYGE